MIPAKPTTCFPNCSAVVEGVRLALQELHSITELYLVGQEQEIKSALARSQLRDPRIQIVHASEVLTMEDKPIVGLRKKKDCSILKAVELVKPMAVKYEGFTTAQYDNLVKQIKDAIAKEKGGEIKK